MGKLKWIVLAVAMAGLGGYACGSDDGDSDGTSTKKGPIGSNGVCATDPKGDACAACLEALQACVKVPSCPSEFEASALCALEKGCMGDPVCSACSNEQEAYASCLKSECPDTVPCL